MNQILIVEDERPIAQLLRMSLEDAGYRCLCAYDGNEGATLAEKGGFDLALLDIMLPGSDGYELLDFLRSMEIPVIFITARASTEDKVKGLRLGAEDYITKPFEIVELLARVETVLRRYNKSAAVLTLGDVCVDTLSRVVTKKGEPVSLTVKEYELVLLFARNRNIALFRDKIYEKVWGDYYEGDSRTVDLHIQRMRKKLGWERNLVPVYKIGYRLEGF